MVDPELKKYSNAPLNDEVRNLAAQGLDGLRAVWTSHWGPAPRMRSPGLLRGFIAWRFLAETYGGLDVETRRQLRAKSVPRKGVLPMGARVSREYRGVRHDVEVVANGVLYEGRRFRSLSAVAREITGVHWNGPRFFGLREEAGI